MRGTEEEKWEAEGSHKVQSIRHVSAKVVALCVAGDSPS